MEKIVLVWKVYVIGTYIMVVATGIALGAAIYEDRPLIIVVPMAFIFGLAVSLLVIVRRIEKQASAQ